MNAVQETKIDRFASRCVVSCQKLLAQIKRSKDAIEEEFRGSVRTHEHALRLALNEAEALAWETDYPHLFFPALAREKALAVASWNTRQQDLQRSSRRFQLAA